MSEVRDSLERLSRLRQAKEGAAFVERLEREGVAARRSRVSQIAILVVSASVGLGVLATLNGRRNGDSGRVATRPATTRDATTTPPLSTFASVSTDVAVGALTMLSPRDIVTCSSPLRWSHDGGNTWSEIRVGLPSQLVLCSVLPTSVVVVDNEDAPNGPSRIYVATGKGAGRPAVVSGAVTAMTFVDRRIGYLLSSVQSSASSDAYRTRDGGRTWSKIATHVPATQNLRFTPGGALASQGGELWRSSRDDLRAWERVVLPVPTQEYGLPSTIENIVTTRDRELIVIAQSTGLLVKDVFVSRPITGGDWSVARFPDSIQLGGTEPRSFAAASSSTWYVTAGARVWRTTNAGSSWSRRSSPSVAVTGTSFFSRDAGAVSGCRASSSPCDAVMITVNGAATWQRSR